jgi:hypothetical protein
VKEKPLESRFMERGKLLFNGPVQARFRSRYVSRKHVDEIMVICKKNPMRMIKRITR